MKSLNDAIFAKMPFDLEETVHNNLHKVLKAFIEEDNNAKNEYDEGKMHSSIVSISYKLSSNYHEVDDFSWDRFIYEGYIIKSFIYTDKSKIIGEYLLMFSLDWEITDDSMWIY